MRRMSRLGTVLLATLGAASALPACGAHRAPVEVAAIPGPWEHRFVELPDRGDDGPLRVHYLAAGPPDAPRVVLVHGFPDLSYGWREVLPLLAGEYRVVAPDLRGYGGTDRPEGGYGVQELAADLEGFLGASATADGQPADTPVHLIAHDWGAVISWWVAMRGTAPLRSYTALSVSHPVAWTRFLEEDAAQRRRARYQKTLAKPGLAGLLAGLGRKQVGGLYRNELVHPELLTEAHVDVYAGAFRTAADWGPPLRYYQRLLADRETNEAAAEAASPVAVPTLVLWGAQDSYLDPRLAPRSCAHVDPGPCEVEVYEDAGHWLAWDLGPRLVTRWRAFVASLPEVETR